MKAHKTKLGKLTGTSLKEVQKNALKVYKPIKARAKRLPHIRSAYFQKDKIFLGVFWGRLVGTKRNDRMRRLKYFACAIELIRTSKFPPTTKQDPNNSNELLHRFAGITKDNEIFYVQIKENKKTNRKMLISVFPEKD